MRRRLVTALAALLLAVGMAFGAAPATGPVAQPPSAGHAPPGAGVPQGPASSSPASPAAANSPAPTTGSNATRTAAEAAPAKAAASAAAAPGSDAQFFAELGYKTAATAADAARAFTILVSEGKETGADYEAARTYLRSRGVLPDGWLNSAKAEDPLEKGHLARLVCRAISIKGGMWMRLLGPQPRLALRECVYLELMAIGPEYQYVTGGELVGVIDRADRWRVREANHEGPKAPAKPAPAAEVKK